MTARTVPLLPCPSIDEIADFYALFGFEQTYRQVRPNPYLAVRKDDLDLHYFGIAGFDPADSYGSCLLLVPEIEPWFDLFSGGLRSGYGRLPLTGLPRITRPRRRKNAEGLTGFSLIDPGGNWIRVMHSAPDTAPAIDEGAADQDVGRLGAALANAVVLADSHGDPHQGAKILEGALAHAERRAAATALRQAEELRP